MQSISVSELYKKMNDLKDVQYLDVRTEMEFKKEHVTGFEK